MNPNATYTPITLTAGHTGTSATKGTVVRGFIGVDTAVGDELVNIPYTYTVG